MPNTAIATAIANSKLFPAVVKDNVADFSLSAPILLDKKNDSKNIITK